MPHHRTRPPASLLAVLARLAPLDEDFGPIAAQAIALGCTVVTDNVGEFSRIENLRVENWLREIIP